MSKTSLSSLVVDQKVSYLRLLFSVSINSAPTRIVCLTEPTLISFTRLPEMINLSLSVGSLYPSIVTSVPSYPEAYRFWYIFSKELLCTVKLPFLVSEKTWLKVPLNIIASTVVVLISGVPKTISINDSSGAPLMVGTPLSINLSWSMYS